MGSIGVSNRSSASSQQQDLQNHSAARSAKSFSRIISKKSCYGFERHEYTHILRVIHDLGLSRAGTVDEEVFSEAIGRGHTWRK